MRRERKTVSIYRPHQLVVIAANYATNLIPGHDRKLELVYRTRQRSGTRPHMVIARWRLLAPKNGTNVNARAQFVNSGDCARLLINTRGLHFVHLALGAWTTYTGP